MQMDDSRIYAEELLEDPEELRALLQDPHGWLARHQLGEADVACPDDAHAALDRAEGVAAKANELAEMPLLEALPRLHELAAQVWGEDAWRFSEFPSGYPWRNGRFRQPHPWMTTQAPPPAPAR